MLLTQSRDMEVRFQSQATETSPFELERIRAVCGLTQANYKASRPPTYAAMLAEGNRGKGRGGCADNFAPDPTDWDPVKIYVSMALTHDMKDLRFG